MDLARDIVYSLLESGGPDVGGAEYLRQMFYVDRWMEVAKSHGFAWRRNREGTVWFERTYAGGRPLHRVAVSLTHYDPVHVWIDVEATGITAEGPAPGYYLGTAIAIDHLDTVLRRLMRHLYGGFHTDKKVMGQIMRSIFHGVAIAPGERRVEVEEALDDDFDPKYIADIWLPDYLAPLANALVALGWKVMPSLSTGVVRLERTRDYTDPPFDGILYRIWLHGDYATFEKRVEVWAHAQGTARIVREHPKAWHGSGVSFKSFDIPPDMGSFAQRSGESPEQFAERLESEIFAQPIPEE